MVKSAEGVIEEAETFTGIVRKIIDIKPRIKRKSYSVTQWEKKGIDLEPFI